jgi:hypothetical protein
MFTRTLTMAAVAGLALLLSAGVQAQDAMSTDGMAMDAMAPMMSDEDLALCVQQAKAITFLEVAMVAEMACNNLHMGHGAMSGDSMMEGDAMAPKP